MPLGCYKFVRVLRGTYKRGGEMERVEGSRGEQHNNNVSKPPNTI